MSPEPTTCPVLPVSCVNTSWDYSAVRISFGASQEMFNGTTGRAEGLQPNWMFTANLSPQTALQLHALLGETIRQYEESIGPLPRLDVMFEKAGSGVPIASGGGQVITLKLVPKTPPPPPLENETPVEVGPFSSPLDVYMGGRNGLIQGFVGACDCHRLFPPHTLWCASRIPLDQP